MFHELLTDKNVKYYTGVETKLLSLFFFYKQFIIMFVSLLHGDGKVSPNAKRDEETLTRRDLACTDDIKTWMTESQLKLNDDKTESELGIPYFRCSGIVGRCPSGTLY